ncbi:MAG: hypothetical protein R3C03_06640 [Pirellulaceae bacterium]
MSISAFLEAIWESNAHLDITSVLPGEVIDVKIGSQKDALLLASLDSETLQNGSRCHRRNGG